MSNVGTRIARVRCIFQLPSSIKIQGLNMPTPSYWPREPLAYVQFFKPATLSPRAERTHKMPSLSKAFLSDGVTPAWSIIPLTNIRQSCHLVPDFSKNKDYDWDNIKVPVLDDVKDFLLNNWLSLYIYQTIYMA